MHTDPEVLALVALGERSAATAEQLDHIAHCEVCGREIAELGHLTQVGRTISEHYTLETPSPQVWERIRSQLNLGHDFSSALVPPSPRTPTSPPVVSIPPAPVAERAVVPPPRRRRVLSLALAAALALLVGIGGTLAWQQLRPAPERVVSAVQLNALPSWSGASGEATLEEDGQGRRWLVVTMATPRPVDGLSQVWLMNTGATQMIPVGLMSNDRGRWEIPADVDVSTLHVVDVSDEDQSGPATHSGNSIVRGDLEL